MLPCGYSAKLEWLEYSLKRSLGLECADEEERELGTLQVTDTLNALNEYENLLTMLKCWLRNDRD